MKISVVIPVYNEEAYIRACLQSLIQQTRKADEIIIVDNNCTDKTIEIAKQYPVRVVVEKKQGITPARNRGFNEAHGTLIARTDADARLPKTWLSRIEKKFEDQKDLVGLCGTAQFYEMSTMVKKSNWAMAMYFKSLRQILKHDVLFGPNMAIRKNAWEKVKNSVCLKDKIVHEDIDLAIHLAFYGKIEHDSKLIVKVSFRRWKKLAPYFDYSYRYLRTIQRHKLALNKGKKLMKKVRVPKVIKNTVSTIFTQ